jgi:HPt (histidine-containing phosphotransfer) domain-containing protein
LLDPRTHGVLFLGPNAPEAIQTARDVSRRKQNGLPVVVLVVLRGDDTVDPGACDEAGIDGVLELPLTREKVASILQEAGERQGASAGPDVAISAAVTVRRTLAEFPSDLVSTVCEKFSGQTRQLVSDLVRAAEAGDLDALKFASHKVAGSALSVGAVELGRLCREVEHSPASTATGRARELTPRILDAFEESLHALQLVANERSEAR